MSPTIKAPANEISAADSFNQIWPEVTKRPKL